MGVQLDASTSHGTYGYEIVIYLDEKVVYNTTEDKSADFAIVSYTYSGIAFNALEMAIAPQVVEMASSLDLSALNKSANDEILITLSGMLTSYQISGSPFIIYGYDNFTSAQSYSGAFDSASFSYSGTNPVLSGGIFQATSDTCRAIGLKFAASVHPRFNLLPLDIQYGRTYYSDPVLLYY